MPGISSVYQAKSSPPLDWSAVPIPSSPRTCRTASVASSAHASSLTTGGTPCVYSRSARIPYGAARSSTASRTMSSTVAHTSRSALRSVPSSSAESGITLGASPPAVEHRGDPGGQLRGREDRVLRLVGPCRVPALRVEADAHLSVRVRDRPGRHADLAHPAVRIGVQGQDAVDVVDHALLDALLGA